MILKLIQNTFETRLMHSFQTYCIRDYIKREERTYLIIFEFESSRERWRIILNFQSEQECKEKMLEITNPYTHAVIVNHDGSNSPKEVYGVKVVNIYNIESVNTM